MSQQQPHDRRIGYIEFFGGRRFRFTDPSGNELVVWSDQ